MSRPVELPLTFVTAPVAGPVAVDSGWLRAARRARQLSWFSLLWMGMEGVVGLLAGAQADSLSLLVWGASSFVEGLASVTIIWRFSGRRTFSPTSERTAQRWVAGSFLLLVPYFLYEAFAKLLGGGPAHASTVGIAVTATAVVLMPLLGRAKLRLAVRLDSDATAGEGVQNLLCAAQAAAALVALIGAGAGLAFVDPIAAVVISAIAVRECVGLWRGTPDGCCAATSAERGANVAPRDGATAPCDVHRHGRG
ncbi:hypothetical protein [Patulibacter defluvii]|uniref:hypothetical protein n=1 Tax=Patulibacter defluvii TaxID=3095358 RepID=UPI002A760EEA|nr:hypothetical protein [Patulibacter sp. DM4]